MSTTRTRIALFLLLVTAVAVQSSSLSAGCATWQGRVLNDSSGTNVSFSWEGVQARFLIVDGTTVWLTASTDGSGAGNFHTIVDGKVNTNWTLYGSGISNITIASSLSPGHHDITLWSATDPIARSWDTLPRWVNSFHTLYSDGLLTPGPPLPSRRLRIIGDSITAGNQIDNETCADDHLGSYGARLCQMFDANCQTLAISGKGIFENCCDNNVTMTELAKRTIVSAPDILYDDADFAPDAVILALGTNDAGKESGPAWVANFTTVYADYIVNLTIVHKNAALPIFCIVGPITHEYYPWVENAITAAAARGVSRATILNWTAQVDRCGHPAWQAHADAAETFRPIIAAALGW